MMQRPVLFIFTLLLLSCSVTSGDRQAPVTVVQRFIAGLEARDASAVVAQLASGDERKQIAPEVRSYLSLVEQIEFREPTYTLVEYSSDRAQVRLTARLVFALRGTEPVEQAVDTLFEVARDGEGWYLHSVEWPGTGR